MTKAAKHVAPWIFTTTFWTEHACHLLYLILLLLYAMNVKEVNPVFYQITSKKKTNRRSVAREERPSKTALLDCINREFRILLSPSGKPSESKTHQITACC
ncbi:hypothetical protein CLOSTMETH_02198 [[Clostridium] methylpentosum DSM 5476]|uniref:Uncharacterized protein n=1 Tax=[Clostridium] methylpentosum DSM 5476 TaxID=537013 RepID=C0EEB8_9FIRM|nr:hypothetical protein CLOSTMETH_02198 [[Clostridium] methylpentosum DSM 5476]